MPVWLHHIHQSVLNFVLCAMLIGTASAAQSQDVQPPADALPVPDVPPSLNEYSLPPGPNSSPPENQVEGPVEEPVEQETGAPTIGANASPPEASPRPPNSPPPDSTTPVTPPSQAAAPERLNRPAPPSEQTAPPPAPFRIESDSANDGDSDGNSANIAPLTKPERDSSASSNSPSEPTLTETVSLEILAAAVILIAMLLSLAFFIRRKRIQQMAIEIDVDRFADAELESAPSDKTEGPAPAASDGYITSKINSSSQPRTVPQRRANQTAANVMDQISMDFFGERMSITLVNAVLGYRIALTNNGGRGLGNLKVRAAMVQADAGATDVTPELPDEILHQVLELKPGKTVHLSGELRLPFSAFRPLQVKMRALLVPLVHVGLEHGATDSISKSYIIGQEHEPPRKTMAPFRLDLGPRGFERIGQRILGS